MGQTELQGRSRNTFLHYSQNNKSIYCNEVDLNVVSQGASLCLLICFFVSWLQNRYP